MFKNKKHRNSLLMLVLLLSSGLHAQNMSVGDMIAKNKAARAAELLGQGKKDDGAKKPKGPIQYNKPKVWSMTGANDSLEAVLLYEQKVFVVHSHNLPAAVGPWQVIKIGDQKIWIKDYKSASETQTVVAIDAPQRDASLDSYAQALNIQLDASDLTNIQGMPAAPNQVAQLAVQPVPLPPPNRRQEPPVATPKPNTK